MQLQPRIVICRTNKTEWLFSPNPRAYSSFNEDAYCLLLQNLITCSITIEIGAITLTHFGKFEVPEGFQD